MRDILAIHFPEEAARTDVLGGYPDFSYGDATDYFSALNPQDREVVHWYTGQYLSPVWAGDEYVFSLAQQYSVVDPLRLSKGGIKAALIEMERVSRYVTLFTECKNFFPWIKSFNTAIRNEKGDVTGSIDELGWGSFMPKNALSAYRNSAIRQLGFIDEAGKFIQDPAASPYFDQARILEDYRLTLERERLHPDIDPDS